MKKNVNWKKYTDFIMKETEAVLNIDSPTGYTENAAAWVKDEFCKLGYDAKLTNKGGVLVALGGKDLDNGLLLEAHVDTLGGMVAEVKRLSLKSPDQCLEASGDFWSLGQLAEELGMKEDAATWTKRGEEIFDSIWPKEFKNIDETYTKMKGNGLYQGTRWQYRWGAPMYLPRMIVSPPTGRSSRCTRPRYTLPGL